MKREFFLIFGIGIPSIILLYLLTGKEKIEEIGYEIIEGIGKVFPEVIEGVTEVIEEIKVSLNSLYQKWSAVFGIDWRLLKAVAITESNENPQAIGDNGNSIGLMQIQFYHWGDYEKEELFDPDKNIERASEFLANMVTKYGRDGGIQAYNLGETKYKQGFRSPDYLSKVISNLESIG